MKATTTGDFPTVLGKSLSFRRLCSVLKVKNQLVFNKDITQPSCLCVICENAVFLAKAINTAISTPICSDVNSLVETFS